MKAKYRSISLYGIILTTLGIIGLTTKTDIIEYFRFDPFIVLSVIIILTLSGIVTIVYIYLQGGFNHQKKDNSELSIDNSDEDMKLYMESFAESFINKLEASGNSLNDDTDIHNLIESKIESITDDVILKKVEDRFGAKAVEEFKYRELLADFHSIKKRLSAEAYTISRNGNINLSIGVITTFLAIFFLGYSLLDVNANSTYSLISSFVPRFALSVFIELFSFFFLRLYKRNLEDIKYFNNEKTNIDLKIVALKTALLKGDEKIINEVILVLSKTERNFVLKKGESTIDIQRNKDETSAYVKTIESLTETIKGSH